VHIYYGTFLDYTLGKNHAGLASGRLPWSICPVLSAVAAGGAKIHKQINILSADRSLQGKFHWHLVLGRHRFFLSREPTEPSRHYPQIFVSSAALIANQSSIQTGIAAERLKALQEMWALRHRITPPKGHPWVHVQRVRCQECSGRAGLPSLVTEFGCLTLSLDHRGKILSSMCVIVDTWFIADTKTAGLLLLDQPSFLALMVSNSMAMLFDFKSVAV
jgi:hypothetical protein